MRRRMEQLINGRFEYEVSGLQFSAEAVNTVTKQGENVRGELMIGTKDRSRMKGMAYSTHRRFLLGKERFSGIQAVIPYGVDVKGLNQGDEISGDIVLCTSMGEHRIPFHIAVEQHQVKTSNGTILDLDAFTSLAKDNFKEAYHLFLDASFLKLLSGEQEILPYYKAMSKNPVTWQHLEEFLIGIGRKEPVSIQLEKTSEEVYEVQNSLKDTLRIRRSGWGYLNAQVSVQGDFLEVEKKTIHDTDFIGSVYEMEYLIRKENIGNGKNYGSIRIQTVYETVIYQVTASKSGKIQVSVDAYEKKKKLEVTRDYLGLCLHKLGWQKWKERTEVLLKELMDTGHFTAQYQLFEAYFYHMADENSKARECLDRLGSSGLVHEQEELEGVYLFLEDMTGAGMGSKEEAVQKLRQLYQRREDSFLLLYVLLQMDAEASKTPSRKIFLLEEQYRTGCRSPFLYLEACKLAETDGTLLRKLDAFSIQILWFAKRNDRMTEEMAFRAVDLSSQLKAFSGPVYEILVYIYKKYPSSQVIKAICKLIMMGNPRRQEYFQWYELAVENDLKITRLYEYYIETMSRNYQKMLPRMVRMYFSYNNTLSDTKKAFVYSNVILNKELDKTTYTSYKKSMEEFACQKIKEGRINEDFAVLYQEFCIGSKDDAVKRALARVLFTQRVYCDDPKIRKIIVRHAALKEEQVYSCADRIAYVSIYTSDAGIVFEDDQQRRYIQTVDYNMQPLFEKQELAKKLLKEGCRNPGLLLYICGELEHENAIAPETLACFQDVTLEEDFSEDYRQRMRKRLLLYYEEHMDNDNLKDSLREMDFHGFAKVNKSLLITILIKQGMYVGAYDLLCEYGFEEIEVNDLLRLCSRMIRNLEFEYEEELLLLAHCVFLQGRYDEVILQYLATHYEGPVREMVQIWESAMGFSIEAYNLEENILVYSMFSRVISSRGAAVLKEYIRQGGKEQVILSYLTYAAYAYFIGNEKTDAFIFTSIEKIIERNWEHDAVCDLSLLRFYAEDGSWTKSRLDRAASILSGCERAGLRFSFFRKLPVSLLQANQLEDKAFAQCQSSPDAKVTIYYRMAGRDQEQEEFRQEPLKNMYHGIFNKEFILFYGEKVEYYFTIEKEQENIKTNNEYLEVPAAEAEGNSKYQYINRMLLAKEQGRTEQLQRELQKYQQQEAWIAGLFQLVD